MHRASSALVVVALVATVVPVSPRAGESPVRGDVRLTDVARVYSLGPGVVRCPVQQEWQSDFAASFGWAYTNLRTGQAVLSPIVCQGALSVGASEVPLWQQALGVLVLVHEAFHLRHWRFRRDEGKVECQALVHARDAAERLGASAEQAELLYPYVLALHSHKVRLVPAYRDPLCIVPPWDPPAGP